MTKRLEITQENVEEPLDIAPEGIEDASECDPNEMPNEELLYDLADLFKVFSDTTRIKILFCLMNTERSVNDIAEVTNTSQSAVSHQLRLLKQSHLVKFRRDGRNIHYSLADDHIYTMLNQGMSCLLYTSDAADD